MGKGIEDIKGGEKTYIVEQVQGGYKFTHKNKMSLKRKEVSVNNPFAIDFIGWT